MSDFLAVFMELKGVFGGAAAVGISVAIYLWTQRGERHLDSQNTAANVSAIQYWRDAAARSDAKEAQERERADKFAQERNEAYRQLALLEGRIQELARQVEQATATISALREEIQQLEARSHAAPGH